MSRMTFWKTDTDWVCAKHLPSLVMPASIGICTFAGCDSVRPRREHFITTRKAPPPSSVPKTESTIAKKKTISSKAKPKVVRVASNAVLCDWFKCDKDNGQPAIARPKSKYCSKDCSNKNARWRHKQRKKTQG